MNMTREKQNNANWKISGYKFYLPKQMGKDQWDDLELLGGLIALRILDGIAWVFIQAK